MRRMRSAWKRTALSLARSGTDIQPLLANAPGIPALADAGRAEEAEASRCAARRDHNGSQPVLPGLDVLRPGRAARRMPTARRPRRSNAFSRPCMPARSIMGYWAQAGEWVRQEVTVEAPPRIDLGGGWSDTPPFCLDWGGTVLNIAVELNGQCPIRTSARRIDELEIRCSAGGPGVEPEVFTTSEQVLTPASPGSPYALVRQALVLAGIVRPGQELRRTLRARGGGLEIATKRRSADGIGTRHQQHPGRDGGARAREMSGAE